jgi:deoxyribodipyrimidine photo-lyase
MTWPGELPSPPAGDVEAVRVWTATHLGDLTLEGASGVTASPRFRGGQSTASAVLAELDIRGYAAKRNQVQPLDSRGASAVSPWIRYGLISLPELWQRVGDAPARDRGKYRDELLWQEYARHLYARVGTGTGRPLRDAPAQGAPAWADPWPPDMECVRRTVAELEGDGWLVNQTRMWLSSQWTVRGGGELFAGEDRFFAHLLDGSRAANRLGWQWTTGALTGRPYGFSRWQVEKRAPELCRSCALSERCPIQEWPDTPAGERLETPEPRLGKDPGLDLDAAAGPPQAEISGRAEAVWLTAESLGDADPALSARADLPAVFVFDAPLLARLRLSGKRLVFLAETLADLATRRELHVLRGDPVQLLAGRGLAVTFAPVPGFARRSSALDVAELHPWPWLSRPDTGSLSSFSTWRRRVALPEAPS